MHYIEDTTFHVLTACFFILSPCHNVVGLLTLFAENATLIFHNGYLCYSTTGHQVSMSYNHLASMNQIKSYVCQLITIMLTYMFRNISKSHEDYESLSKEETIMTNSQQHSHRD